MRKATDDVTMSGFGIFSKEKQLVHLNTKQKIQNSLTTSSDQKFKEEMSQISQFYARHSVVSSKICSETGSRKSD